MKKRAGFTLIELIVGMAIMAIIFGGIVYIFGTTSKSAQAGMNHKQAYEATRTMMDELKTSMRYAETITPGADSITYKVTKNNPVFQEHWINNISEGESYDYTYTISWKDSNKKQLKIERTFNKVDSNGNETAISVTSPVYFPSDEYVNANGAFASTEYKKHMTNINQEFPIEEQGLANSGTSVYSIVLPIQYKDATGGTKVDILQTEVTGNDYKAYDKKHTTGDTSAATAKSQAEVLLTAVTAMYNDTSLTSQLKTSNGKYVSNISSSAFNQSGLKGITLNLKNYISSTSKTGLDTLGDTAWIIAPIDANGNVLTSQASSVYGWRVFIAKNVVNDANNISTQSDADTTCAEEAAKGNYIIRGGYGFLAYYYDSTNDGNGRLSFNPNNTIYTGYMTGYKYSDTMVMINFFSWASTYKTLKYYISSYSNMKSTASSNYLNYVEAYYDSNGKLVTPSSGKYWRIDYDASGNEYTVATFAKDNKTYSSSDYTKNIATATIY